MELSMFETLLNLPLFQGLSRNDLTLILEKVKFRFRNLNDGDVLQQQGTPCEDMVFLMNGEVSVKTEMEGCDMTFYESRRAPVLIQPETLFGLHPAYTHSFIAKTAVTVVEIEKGIVLSDLFNYDVFRLNFFNVLCTQSQYLSSLLWRHIPDQVEDRIAHFFLTHAISPVGDKALRTRMCDFADYLSVSRIALSRALNHLNDKGLILLSRGLVKVPLLEDLFTLSEK